MAVALDEEQQYVGFALGQLLAGRLGKRQLRVSVLCVADRQPATARALLAELRSQARAMLAPGERLSSLEAAVAPQRVNPDPSPDPIPNAIGAACSTRTSPSSRSSSAAAPST